MSRRREPMPKASALASRLSAKEVLRRSEQCARPADHPNPTDPMESPDRDCVKLLREMLDRSGVVPCLERRLCEHPGPQSRVPLLALLVGLFYTGGPGNRYWRSDVALFLASLHPQVAVDLGVQSPDELLPPISYNAVCKQARRLERALRDGWVDAIDAAPRDFDWLYEEILRATVPADIAIQIEAVALDTTDDPTWASQILWIDEHESVTDQQIAELNKTRRPREGSKRRAFKRDTDLIGHRRADGKYIRSRDPDAGRGYRSKAGEHEAGPFHGSHLTAATAVKARRVTGNHKAATFGPDVPAYVVGADYSPAGTSPATVGKRTMDIATELCPNVSDVVADMGFTQQGEKFNRVMHEMGIHVTMDAKDIEAKKAVPVKLGPSGFPAFNHVGTLLHPFTPKHLRVPAMSLNKWERENFYLKRAPFELIANQHYDDGGKQFQNPVNRGRLNIDPSRHTGTAHTPLYPKPADFDEHFPDIQDNVLSRSHIKVGAEQLDKFQQPPKGTPAHEQSYTRRLPSENTFAQLKEDDGLSKKKCRILGGGRALAALTRLAWYNTNITRKIVDGRQARKQTRRRVNATQPKTYPSRPSESQKTSATADVAPNKTESTESRAPP